MNARILEVVANRSHYPVSQAVFSTSIATIFSSASGAFSVVLMK